MQLTENECSEALTRLLRPYFAKVDVQNVYHSINKGHSIEEDSNLLTLLIQEYFSNPPLKFDELKEGMVIWDNKEKIWIEIYSVHEYEGGDEDKNYDYEIFYYKFGWECLGRLFYEPNRFYRKEVINHDN